LKVEKLSETNKTIICIDFDQSDSAFDYSVEETLDKGVTKLWKIFENDNRSASFFMDNEKVNADIRVLDEHHLVGKCLILQQPVKATSSPDIIAPTGAIFTIE
jgi:hypothetical protein